MVNPYESPPVMAEFAERPMPPRPEVRRFPWWSLVFLLVLPGLWLAGAVGFRAMYPLDYDGGSNCVNVGIASAAFWFWPAVASAYALARYAQG